MKKRITKVSMALCLFMVMVMVMSVTRVNASVFNFNPTVKNIPDVNRIRIHVYPNPTEIPVEDGTTLYEYSSDIEKMEFSDGKTSHSGDDIGVYVAAYGDYYLFVSFAKYDEDGDFYKKSSDYELYINNIKVDSSYINDLGGAKIPLEHFIDYELNLPDEWVYTLMIREREANKNNLNNENSNSDTNTNSQDTKEDTKVETDEETYVEPPYIPVVDPNGFVHGPSGTVYRFYNPANNKHLFTTQITECNELIEQGWEQEDHLGRSVVSDKGVYRLYNPATFEHLYTSDIHECTTLTNKAGWEFDNDSMPLFFSSKNGKTPVYRLYNPSLYPIASHHYTSDKNEIRILLKNGWQYDNNEKPVFYLN